MKSIDYYQLLGINRGASQEILKRAFRARITSVHPDHNPDDELALERTRTLIEAYKTLSNPLTRKQYDMSLMPTAHRSIVPVVPAPSPVAALAYRAFTTIWALALIVFLTITLTRTILGDGDPGYKPVLTEMQSYDTPKTIPVLTDPNISNCLEWYLAQEYKLSLADDWAKSRMLDTYADAQKRARKLGDRISADFYKSSISTINVSSAYASKL